MFQRATSRSSRTSSLRTRMAVMAVGLGATAVLGTGVASAASSAVAPKAVSAKVAASWVDPVKKYTLSASFAQAGSMWQSTHSGQDFAVASGTNVVAAHGGTVVKAGGNGAGDGAAYGNAIVIKHGNGTYSQYAHLSRIDVKVGQSSAPGSTSPGPAAPATPAVPTCTSRSVRPPTTARR